MALHRTASLEGPSTRLRLAQDDNVSWYTGNRQLVRFELFIASRYLEGQWFKLRGLIPAFTSMEKTAKMFQDLSNSAPFSNVGPHAQLQHVIAVTGTRHVHGHDRVVHRFQAHPCLPKQAFSSGAARRKTHAEPLL